MKKLLSVILAIAVLSSVGAVVAFAGVDCGCDDCEVVGCACVGSGCADTACECLCHEEETPANLSGYELWKLKLTTGKLGAVLQKVAEWGDWVLKVLYYVCFGWLYNIVIDITVTPK